VSCPEPHTEDGYHLKDGSPCPYYVRSIIMSEHPSLQIALEKEAKERETVEKALSSLNKPLDLKEVTEKLERIKETQAKNIEEVHKILEELSVIDQTQLELMQLMIKRYRKVEG